MVLLERRVDGGKGVVVRLESEDKVEGGGGDGRFLGLVNWREN